jgi:hypothetical protein
MRQIVGIDTVRFRGPSSLTVKEIAERLGSGVGVRAKNQRCYTEGELYGLRVSTHGYDLVQIEGSLPNAVHGRKGGLIEFETTIEFLKFICEYLCLNYSHCILYRIDVACDVWLSNPAEKYFVHFVDMPKHLRQNTAPSTLEFWSCYERKKRLNEFEIYGKLEELKLLRIDLELPCWTRLELRLHKCLRQQLGLKGGPFFISSLESIYMQRLLVLTFQKFYDNIEKVNCSQPLALNAELALAALMRVARTQGFERARQIILSSRLSRTTKRTRIKQLALHCAEETQGTLAEINFKVLDAITTSLN